MEKKLDMLGIVDKDGYELENRVYGRWGGCPTERAGNAKISTIRKVKYEKKTNRYTRCDRQHSAAKPR